MAELLTIARPYAQAVFRLAQENKAEADWSVRLQRLALIAQDARMARLIGNPQFSADEMSALLFSLCEEPQANELKALLNLLADNERLSLLPYVQVLFEHLKDGAEGIKEADVVSAFPLNDSELNDLLTRLETHFASRLRPHLTVDPTLIGGICATVGGEVLDASVRGKLNAMAVELKKN